MNLLKTALPAALLTGLMLSPDAMAGSCSGVFCTDVALDLLYINSTGVFVATSGAETALTCTPNSSQYLTLPKTHGNYASIFSTLQAALISGKTVNLRIEDASVGCNVLYITIKG